MAAHLVHVVGESELPWWCVCVCWERFDSLLSRERRPLRTSSFPINTPSFLLRTFTRQSSPQMANSGSLALSSVGKARPPLAPAPAPPMLEKGAAVQPMSNGWCRRPS